MSPLQVPPPRPLFAARRAVVIAALLFLALPALAQQVITIGVVDYRPKAEMQARWQPLMDYLTATLPDKQVRMPVLSRDEMEASLRRRDLDFVFTIPANYEPVSGVMRELRLPPYDSAAPFSLADIWARYRPWLIASGAAGLLILALALWVVLINRRLREEQRKATTQATALRESETQFRSLLQSIPGVVYRCALDEHWTIHFVSDHIETLTGYPLADFLANRVRSYASIIHPDDVEKVDQAVRDGVAGGSPYSIEYRILHASGEVRWVFENGQAEFGEDGKVAWLDGVITDVSDRKRAEQDLHRFRFMVENTPQEVWLARMDGAMAYANPAAAAGLGYTPEEISRMSLGDVAPEGGEHFPKVAASLKSAALPPFETRHRAKDGRFIPKEIRAAYLNIDGDEYICGFAQDITARREAEEQIRQLAYFDTLTDLPNRRLLMDRLGQALIASTRSQEYGALIMLDLDHFKTLNDTMGHDIGDRLLVQVAQRLLASVRKEDTVARLGGDEFVIVLEGLGTDEQLAAGQAELVAEKVRATLNEPYALTGKERDHHTTSSIGLTLFHRADTALEGLLKQADMALYQAKDAGRNTIRFFNPAMQAAIDARMAMDSALRRGLRQGELRLFYQPQFDYRGRLLGAEALLRWQPPGQAAISPAQFIPLAESTGLIIPIGLWVMETACKQLKAWEPDPRTRHLNLAVNLSVRQFLQPDFVEQVAAVLRHSGVKRERLKFELTESALLEDMEAAIVRMDRTRALGVAFSLDDFGTGFSSLSYLKRLPLDQVKIDQSFVRDIAVDANDAAIVSAILAMSRTLGLHVIAEGVETEEQLDFLRHNGCTAFQGYLFGRPLPIEEWGAFLEGEAVTP